MNAKVSTRTAAFLNKATDTFKKETTGLFFEHANKLKFAFNFPYRDSEKFPQFYSSQSVLTAAISNSYFDNFKDKNSSVYKKVFESAKNAFRRQAIVAPSKRVQLGEDLKKTFRHESGVYGEAEFPYFSTSRCALHLGCDVNFAMIKEKACTGFDGDLETAKKMSAQASSMADEAAPYPYDDSWYGLVTFNHSLYADRSEIDAYWTSRDSEFQKANIQLCADVFNERYKIFDALIDEAALAAEQDSKKSKTHPA